MANKVGALLIPLLLLYGCAPTTPSSSVPAEPTATVAPTEPPVSATTAPAPTATVVQLPELPFGTCCRGAELDAGTYRLPELLGLELSLDVPSGMRIIREDAVNVLALVRGKNSLGDVSEWVALFVLEDDEPADQFQEDLLAMENFTVLAEPLDVTIAGFSGWRADLQALPNPGYEGSPQSGIPPESQVVPVLEEYFVGGSFSWTTASPEARVTVFCLDIDGRDLVIYVEAPQVDFEESIQNAINTFESLRPIA